MIRRAPRPESGFTIIRNTVLRDERLSYRARGVLAAILSRPDNWKITRDQLAAEGREGRDAIGSALRELEDAGYLERVRVQTGSGCWVTEVVCHDQPVSWESAVFDGFSAGFQEPMTGKPTTGFPTDGFPVANRRNDKKKREENSLTLPDGFVVFWELYPRKIAKPAALKAWRSAVKRADSDTILGGLRLQLGELCAREKGFVPHPATWLNQDRWQDQVDQGVRSAVELLRGEFEDDGRG